MNGVADNAFTDNLSDDAISVEMLFQEGEIRSDLTVEANRSTMNAEVSSTIIREESVRMRKKNEKKQKITDDKIKYGEELLNKINIDIGNEGKIEQTWERIILAEKMRIQLSHLNDQKRPNLSVNSNFRGRGTPSAAELYVNFINENFVAPIKLVAR